MFLARHLVHCAGWSALGKTLLRLVNGAGGAIRFDGQEIAHLPPRAVRPFGRRMQMIFQDPFGSRNLRHTVGEILHAPLVVHGIGDKSLRARRVRSFVDRVGLPAAAIERYPHENAGDPRYSNDHWRMEQVFARARGIANPPRG